MADIETIALDTRYFAEVVAPATPATGKAVVYVKADGKLYIKDDTGAETDLTASGGMTNPMTTAEDLIVGGASGTPGRLAVGSNGQVLTVTAGAVGWAASSGGISSGTTFPGSPTSGDLYFRTDHDMLFTYDGTRWICVCPHEFSAHAQAQSATTDTFKRVNTGHTLDILLEELTCTAYVPTTNGASDYWTMDIDKVDSADAKTNVATVGTSAGAANAWVGYSHKPAAVVAVATYPISVFKLTKTGAPGNMSVSMVMRYRYIAT